MHRSNQCAWIGLLLLPFVASCSGCDDAANSVDAGAADLGPGRGDGPSGGDAEPGAELGPDSGVIPDATTLAGAVLEHHGNGRRDGFYIDPAFTRAAASRIRRDMTFNAQVMGPIYAQPLYFPNGPGGRDLVIVATERNEVLALDAADGTVVWRRGDLGAPVPLSQLECGNINLLGITGTPVIDPGSRTVFFDAMTTPNGGTTKRHLIYALSIDDGTTRSGGWPVDVSASVRYAGMSFDSAVHNQRSALTLLNGVIYVTYGGHFGDCGSYRGWVVGVPINDPRSPSAWATRAQGAGIWAPGGPSTDGASLFIATGNGFNSGSWMDGEAVIRLDPGPTFSSQITNYFAPSNWMTMDTDDQDLGGTAPVLFDVPGSNPSALTIALTKDGRAFLLDRANLGGVGGQLANRFLSPLGIITAAAAYRTSRGTYVTFHGNCPAGNGDQVTIKINPGSPPSIAPSWCVNGHGGPTMSGSPIATATDDSGTDAIVWVVGAEGDNRLHGFDGDTGAVVFGGGGAPEALGSVTRFQAPIVVSGRMFIAANNRIFAFTVR